MNALRFISASLRHYRRIHMAVALGVAVATAVLTGALLVGDSVRGSLRDLTIERLGRIDTAIVSPHMFRAKLAHEFALNVGDITAPKSGEMHANPKTAPAILFNGSLQSGTGQNARRATSVSVVGFDVSFWALGEGGPAQELTDGEVAITESLANELEVQLGDGVLLRVPAVAALPADSPLGDKQSEKTTRSRRLSVAAILPPVGLARFSLIPSQQLPRNVFLPLATLEGLLDQPGKANAILVASAKVDTALSAAAQKIFAAALQPKLQDLGVRIDHIYSPTKAALISTDALVIPDEVVRAAERAFPNGELQPIVTYLANTISVGESGSERTIPYSVVTGVDSTADIGPLIDDSGQPIALADDEIALNKWAADDLGAKVGDVVRLKYYEPESTHGNLRERETPPFKLRAIVPLESADGKPTTAADPKLTPELPGVTDQKSINDWELPFELVEKIRPQDEDYWDKYRTTPKAFVSLATAKKLWPSRWGTISLLRGVIGKGTAENYAAALQRELKPADVGMTILPVKEQGLAAASGTTPFDGLFLGFSFFLIAAAVMLIALLFRLGVEQRARELGTLAAVGVGRRRIARLLGREGFIVAAIGSAIGVAAGVLYAWLMILGLRTWWVAAVATPFMELHVTPRSLVLGWAIGLVVSWLTIRWTIRRLVRQPASRLLSGSVVEMSSFAGGRGRIWSVARIALVLLIAALIAFGFRLQGEAQAGVFFGSGAATLALLLGEIRHRMRRSRVGGKVGSAFSLSRLSSLNTTRNPGRSTLTIGLVAAASFLIIAVSAFRLDSGEGGTGGFEFIATSDPPIHFDLNTTEGRRELGFSDQANRELDTWRVFSLRVAAGEDASCLNLYRPMQPRVLGVPDVLIERGGFDWAAIQAPTKGGDAEKLRENPWRLLQAPQKQEDEGRRIIPVVLDASTAMYSLHLKGVGSRFTIRDAADQAVTLEVVGLLKNSVLQGNLLMSETNFLRLFPNTGGYRFFLIDQVAPPSRGGLAQAQKVGAQEVPIGLGSTSSLDPLADGTRSVPATLESALADDGFDVVDAREQLAAFLAVQNTYLSTFQSLGALGLLLGTVGLAVVQLRSVLERRGELALMRAAGFRRNRLVGMVIFENAMLLLGGLAVGCVAATVALVPQWAPHGASVPWRELAALLGIIALAGLAAGWLATRWALRAPIVPALRGD